MDEKKINWFNAIQEHIYKEEHEEESYLKELAGRLALKEPRSYLSVRSIVLDVHFKLERILSIY